MSRCFKFPWVTGCYQMWARYAPSLTQLLLGPSGNRLKYSTQSLFTDEAPWILTTDHWSFIQTDSTDYGPRFIVFVHVLRLPRYYPWIEFCCIYSQCPFQTDHCSLCQCFSSFCYCQRHCAETQRPGHGRSWMDVRHPVYLFCICW